MTYCKGLVAPFSHWSGLFMESFVSSTPKREEIYNCKNEEYTKKQYQLLKAIEGFHSDHHHYNLN